MRIKHLLFMAATAMFAFTACEDPETENSGSDPANGGGSSNYWYAMDLAPKGVKSIADDNYTENFDADGRLISIVSLEGETTFTYNSKGLLTKLTNIISYDGNADTTIMTYEYNNSGKFCPIPMSAGNVFHIYQQGLAPGLSKVRINDAYNGGEVVMEYKFQGDNLIITTTGGTKLDSLGNVVPIEWETSEFEYAGAYPYRITKEHEFIGPLTYQENGMFDQYVEGFFSWNPEFPGFVTQRSTRYVNKSRKDKMLVDRMVIESYNDGVSTPWNIQTVTSTYNDKGDLVSETTINTEEGSEDYLATYEYEYDQKGNWTKVTITNSVTRSYLSKLPEPTVYTNERTITYY